MLDVGDKVQVEIAEIDPRGKLSLVPVEVVEGEAASDAGRRRTATAGRRPRRRPDADRDRVDGRRADRDGHARRHAAPAPRRVTRRAAGRRRPCRRTVLPGGLRVVTETMPGVRSVAFGIWVGVGSRDEAPRSAGATHYLEHLLFKGTERRSALEISAALDAVGGEINAFTAKEYTCYYARVLDADLPLAIDVVCDMVTSSLIDADGRRGRARRDPRRDRHARRRPGRRRARRVRRRRVRRHPARPAHPRHGRLDQRADPRRRSPATTARHYQPPNLVVAAAGNVDHDAVVALVAQGVRRRRRRWTAAPDPPRPGAPGAGAARRPGPACGWCRAAHRAGQPGARRASGCPARRPALRARRAQRRPRRRHVVAAVPGGPGEARAGLLGVQLHLAATPTPACSASTRAACPRKVDEVLEHLPRASWPRRRRRAHRRGAGPRQGPDARVARAGPGGHRRRG